MTDQPAAGEQPEQASTAQQQEAWSAAQQYPFHPQQQPYGWYGSYGQPPYQQGPYGWQPTRALPDGSYTTGEPSYQYGGGAFPPGPDYWAPPPLPRKKHPHRLLYGSVAASVATALAIGGIALAVDHANGNSSQQTSLTTPNQQNPLTGNGGTGNGFGFGGGLGNDGNGNNGNGNGSSGAGTTGPASTAQQVGIVDINTTIDYGQGKAAGTGIVLNSNGEVLTNNHVVQDSTSLSVTVVSTGKTYSATVVGTDPTDDIAVIQLKGASGLATAKLGDSSKVTVGMSVTAVGNAGGTGGTPTAATGTVSAINQSITASDDNGSNAERLTGMIQVNANIQPGDSGGALYENAGGTVIGMNTAASSSSGRFGFSAGTTGFAIPIAKATNIADQIESGNATSTIHIGYPAFLGVRLDGSAASQTGGVTIAGVISGTAAAKAGLGAGDTITAVDGKAISSPTTLSTIMASHRPGDQVTLSYTNSSGQSQTVTVTLGQGPAD
ncbi:MAG TPA: trypsin-like peptidase domain-containing protein [Jatrophihabitans sp.]|nr:trypsin-like peptidase domain-containing protein [Jatrophihabitans sp.]